MLFVLCFVFTFSGFLNSFIRSLRLCFLRFGALCSRFGLLRLTAPGIAVISGQNIGYGILCLVDSDPALGGGAGRFRHQTSSFLKTPFGYCCCHFAAVYNGLK